MYGKGFYGFTIQRFYQYEISDLGIHSLGCACAMRYEWTSAIGYPIY